jgi:hypothetical protein
LCEVARELAERGLDLGGEQVVGWDNGGVETSEMYNLFSFKKENLVVIQGGAVLCRLLIIAVC